MCLPKADRAATEGVHGRKGRRACDASAGVAKPPRKADKPLFRSNPVILFQPEKETVVFPPLLPTYNRTDIAFVRGEGSYLFAEDGKRYLDFGSGVAVNARLPWRAVISTRRSIFWRH